MTTATRPRCTGLVEAHGRRWRCTRSAAKKHDYRFCGFCAPTPNYCGRTADDRFRYHRADCAGCASDCCADPSQHVEGRCYEHGTLRPMKPGEVVSVP